jgi:hypothetical protein
LVWQQWVLVVLYLVAWGVSLARGDGSRIKVPEIVVVGVVSLVVAMMVWSIPGGGMMPRFVVFCLLAVNLIAQVARVEWPASRNGRVAHTIVGTVFIMVMIGAIVLV